MSGGVGGPVSRARCGGTLSEGSVPFPVGFVVPLPRGAAGAERAFVHDVSGGWRREHSFGLWHGMRSFHFHRMLNIQTGIRFFPSPDSMTEAFHRLFLWNFRQSLNPFRRGLLFPPRPQRAPSVRERAGSQNRGRPVKRGTLPEGGVPCSFRLISRQPSFARTFSGSCACFRRSGRGCRTA